MGNYIRCAEKKFVWRNAPYIQLDNVNMTTNLSVDVCEVKPEFAQPFVPILNVIKLLVLVFQVIA